MTSKIKIDMFTAEDTMPTKKYSLDNLDQYGQFGQFRPIWTVCEVLYSPESLDSSNSFDIF